MPAGPARLPSESARAAASGAARIIKIKSLRYMSRDIITPRAGRSVADQGDRLTVPRGGIWNQAIAAAGHQLGAHREAADRAALRHPAVDQEFVLPGGKLDLARRDAHLAPIDPSQAHLHRRTRAHHRVRTHDRALVGRKARSLVSTLGRAARQQYSDR